MYVLIAKGDRAKAEELERTLNSEGFTAHMTDSGEDAISLVKTGEYDVLLLHMYLTDMGGREVLQTLRTNGFGIPVIMVTDVADIEVKVSCFSAGADDYVVKPLHKAELFARIRAVARRSKGYTCSTIAIGSLKLNLDGKTLKVGELPVKLTSMEYRMLELLALHRGRIVTRETALAKLYSRADPPETNIIDVAVCRVRKKLEAHGEYCLETVWGLGYRLNESLPRETVEAAE